MRLIPPPPPPTHTHTCSRTKTHLQVNPPDIQKLSRTEKGFEMVKGYLKRQHCLY